MIEYRKALPQEREAYIAFADKVFTDNDGRAIRFDQALPKVYGPGVDSAWMQHLAVDDEKGIRGLIALMPNELYAGGMTLKTGFIGTVSVHAEARGEGHMKKLMQMCLDEMRSSGVDLALLNGQRQRYEYFGYAKSGVRWEVTVGTRNVRHALRDVDASRITFEKAEPGSPWVRQARDLYEQRAVRFRRDPEAFVDICRSYENILWAALEGGEFLGYVISNQEKNEIPEMYAETLDGFDRMIKGWFALGGVSKVRLCVPDWERALRRHLGVYAETIRSGSSTQARILRPRRVLKALLTAKAGYAALAEGEMGFEIEGDSFTVRVLEGKVEILDGAEHPHVLGEKEATELFACPFEYEGRPETPAGWFPLPIYAASPDSF